MHADRKEKKTKTLPYCYLFSRELNFAKMERAYIAGLNFRDLAKKYAINLKNTIENVWNKFSRLKYLN